MDAFSETVSPPLVREQEVITFLNSIHLINYLTQCGAKDVQRCKDLIYFGSQPEGDTAER